MRTRRLAILLSKLEKQNEFSLELEQYTTDGDLAARWLADIASFGDLSQGCTVTDLGAGNGILGLGAIASGAGKANLVETDDKACQIARSNAKSMGVLESIELIQATIGTELPELGQTDLVISNPPWGRQTPKADRPFLEAILTFGVHSHIMHSAEATHIEPFFEGAGWHVERYGEADFALPSAYAHHSRYRGRTRASFWRLSPS
mgnify:CR=1 FL=1